MEDIARDPDIGPEFIALLTHKVKSTREALNISLKDNADLRKEITEIKEQVQKLSSKSGAIDGQAANVTCQFGQCTDAVESLRMQLAETAEKLKATQEALAESLNEVARLKGNYGRAEGRAHERQEAVLELQAGSRGFPDTQERINSSGPELPVSSEDIPGPEADNASGPPTVQSSTPSTDERTSQPCMPPHMAPCQVPKGLMCKGGSLFWPERSLVDHIHGAAITFGCQKRYDRSVADEAQRWIPSIELLGLKGKLREVFHRQDGEILYAGTFQASTAMSQYGVAEYRALPEDLRKHLLNLSFAPAPPGHPKVSEEEKVFVATKYWSGEATLVYLRWDRVGFNAELFNALVSLREAYASLNSENGTHEVSASGGKRKDEGHGLSSRKKFRFDQSVAISHLL